MLRRSQHTLIRVPSPSVMFDSIFCSRGLGFLWFCRYTYTFLVIHLCSQTTTTVIWVLFLFCSPNVALIFKIYQRILKWGGWDEQAIVQTGELFEDALLKLRVGMGDLYICPRCTPRPYPSDTKKNNDTTLETTVRRIINSSVLLLCACCVHIYNQSHIYNPFITGVLHQLVDVYQPYGVSTVKRGSLDHNHTLHAGHPSILLSYSSSRRSNWYCRCYLLASSVIVFIVSGVCSA